VHHVGFIYKVSFNIIPFPPKRGFRNPPTNILQEFSPASNALHTPPMNLTDPIVKMFGKVFLVQKTRTSKLNPDTFT